MRRMPLGNWQKRCRERRAGQGLSIYFSFSTPVSSASFFVSPHPFIPKKLLKHFKNLWKSQYEYGKMSLYFCITCKIQAMRGRNVAK
jgi:hypothetical protein